MPFLVKRYYFSNCANLYDLNALKTANNQRDNRGTGFFLHMFEQWDFSLAVLTDPVFLKMKSIYS